MKTEVFKFKCLFRWLISAFLLAIIFSSTSCRGNTQQIPDNENIAMKNNDLPRNVKIIRNEKNGSIIFLKGPNLSASLEVDTCFRELKTKNRAADIAQMFITSYRQLFRLANPNDELVPISTLLDDLGLTHIRFQQVYKKIPVLASEIIVHLDKENRVYLVNGRYIPTPDQICIRPDITREDAVAIVENHLGGEACNNNNCPVDLVIYPEQEGVPKLAFRVEVSIRLGEGWVYFIDANEGKVLERRTMLRTYPGPNI